METKKLSLFEISEDQQEIIDAVESFDGEITPEIEQALMINEKNRNQKVMAYVNVFQTSDALISTAQIMKKRCEAIIKRENNKQDRMKASLLSYIKQFGAFTIGVMSFRTKKSSSVKVEVEVNELPEEYRTKNLKITPNLKALKEALNNGEEIDGVSIQNNQNLKIN